MQVPQYYIDLWHAIHDIQLSDQRDNITWKWTSSGSYAIASTYKIQLMGCMDSNLIELVWIPKIPVKLKLSSWICIQGRYLTADRLAKRGW